LFEDGANVQAFGSQHLGVWTYNTLHNMLVGFSVQGRLYGGGVQPAYMNEVNYNRLINCSSGISTTVSGGNMTGPWIRGLVFRRNILQQRGSITISSNVSDAVVEHNRLNSISALVTPVAVKFGTDHVLLNNNIVNATDLPDPNEQLNPPCAFATPTPSPSAPPSAGAVGRLASPWGILLRCLTIIQ
jgi:hypothetical protein